MIRLCNISKVYKSKSNSVVALDNINLELEDSGFIFINGKSGSGKTTLLNMIAGLDEPTEGNIYIDGVDTQKVCKEFWEEYRNTDVGIVFQNYNLIDDYTVYDNLKLTLILQKNIEDIEDRIDEVLKLTDLYDYKFHKANELSGGQKQRVAIARAIIKRPKIVLADEATGNLDGENTESILDIFNKISKKCLVVLISHNESSAEQYGDRIIKIEKGKIVSNIDNSKNTFEYNIGDKKPSTINIGNLLKFVFGDIKKRRNYTLFISMVISFIIGLLIVCDVLASNNYFKSISDYIACLETDYVNFEYSPD
ncbi:MAG: ABC transporter ATP-binding protein [Agathobacter sp.]|nr:ABC transporter ATP-binding protein [Agathobacter sp.]